MDKAYIVIVNSSITYWDYSDSIPLSLFDYYKDAKFFNTESEALYYLNREVGYDRIFKLGINSINYLDGIIGKTIAKS